MPVFAFLSFKPINDPVAVFLLILAIMLVAPLLFERLRLPGIVGLILAGVVVGPEGLGLLERDENIILLGTVGLLFLMFMAGLETSLDDFKENGDKAVVFGLATFIAPMILGTAAMMALGYGFLAAVLVASCFASHTLLALPVLNKLGIMRVPAVNITLGATLITNVVALLVLAVVVKADGGNLSIGFWLFLIPALTIYTLATLWGVPIVGRWFFRQFGHDESAEFIFVLATLFIISYVASLIEKEAEFSSSELGELAEDVFVAQLHGGFARQICSKIHRNDLVILATNTSNQRSNSKSAVGRLAEAVARSHTEISVLVIHFPNSH